MIANEVGLYLCLFWIKSNYRNAFATDTNTFHDLSSSRHFWMRAPTIRKDIYCNCLSWVEWIQSSFGWIIFSVYWLHLARVLYGAQIWMLAPLILLDCLPRAYMHTGSELTECGTKHMTHVKPNQLNLFA